jgi:hypothetical protein
MPQRDFFKIQLGKKMITKIKAKEKRIKEMLTMSKLQRMPERKDGKDIFLYKLYCPANGSV